MIGAFKTAIYSKYDASPTLEAALVNGLHYMDAPDNTALPYGVFHIVSGVKENTMGEEYENILVQFNLYSGDKSQCDSMFDALDSVYDMASLSMTGYANISCLREFVYAPDTQIERVWQITTQYRIRMEKN